MLDRIKSAILGTNFALLSFIALSIKATITSISLSEALAFACACGILGYTKYLKTKTPDPVRINEEIKKDLDNVKASLSALKMEKTITAKNTKFF